MAKLEGIIYKAFENYVVLRGFAKISELAAISKKSDSYQRVADEYHKKEIIRFLEKGRYVYFPDVILACRAENYSQFRAMVGSDDDVDFSDASFVAGLVVMHEYLPVKGHRARHANISVANDNKLFRIDGNHRLEPFDEPLDWWFDLIKIPDEVLNETDSSKKEAWIKYHAEEFKKRIGSQIVPYTIIFTDLTSAEDFEAGIFHNINFRHLPLREEASLKILSERSTFDVSSLGYDYELAKELIHRANNGFFRGISILTPAKSEDKNNYRTSCLRVAQLLSKLQKSDKALHELYMGGDFIDIIEETIQSLRPIYRKWGKYKQGNSSLLAALVYYGIISPTKQRFFINWVDKNGINRIGPDNAPNNTGESLVKMFEQVYQCKSSRVFISMQFEDPQSELIYEKILRAIDAFNIESSRDIKVVPLRIDKHITGGTYTITEEILAAIESSSLVIADLSSGNKNVYHEVGYAMALARVKEAIPSVILLLKEDTNLLKPGESIDKFVGFNLRGFTQLRFAKYDDLASLLKEQLAAHFLG